MRLPLYLIAAVLLLTTQAQAQVKRFELAAQVGPSVSWLSGNDFAASGDPLFRPTGGFTLKYNPTATLGVRTGVQYQQKGSRFQVLFVDPMANTIGDVQGFHEFSYVTVPLSVSASFGHRLRFAVDAGGYAGFLLSARRRYTDELFPTRDITNDFTSTDLGLTAGVGLSYLIGPRFGVGVEGRYDMGLVNISALPVYNDGTIKTHLASFLIGCSYRFGKAL